MDLSRPYTPFCAGNVENSTMKRYSNEQLAFFARYCVQRANANPLGIDLTNLEIISSLIPDWQNDCLEEAYGPIRQHGAIQIGKTPGDVLGLKKPDEQKPSSN